MKDKKLVKKVIPMIVLGSTLVSGLSLVPVFASAGSEIKENSDSRRGWEGIYTDKKTGIQYKYIKEGYYINGKGKSYKNIEDEVRVVGLDKQKLTEKEIKLEIDKVNIDGVEYEVTSIGKRAFSCCESLTEVVIGDSVHVIGNGAFSACIDLKKLTLGKNIEIIEWWAFSNCPEIKELVIADGLKELNEVAFRDCKGLTCVEFEGSVEEINSRAFAGCGEFEVKLKDGMKIYKCHSDEIGDEIYEGHIKDARVALCIK